MGAREAIAAAALDLVAGGGLEAVSVRSAAARAGVSPGLVQHHYATKQGLLLAAMDLVSERVRSRVTAAAAAVGDAPVADQIRYLALQLLPLDDQRRTEARVWLAFVARAAVDEQVAARHSREWRVLQDVLAQMLAGLRGLGAVSNDDQDEAAHLLAVLDGMAVAGVAETGRMTPQRMQRLLDRLMDRLPTELPQPGASTSANISARLT